MPKQPNHWAILMDNDSDKASFIRAIQNPDDNSIFTTLKSKKGQLFSPITLQHFIDEEERHDKKIIYGAAQPLRTMSSGEQKKALFFHLLTSKPDYIILDNPFDNLDRDFQKKLIQILTEHSQDISFIQLASRKTDILPFIKNYGRLIGKHFECIAENDLTEYQEEERFHGMIPSALEPILTPNDTLIHFKNVSVSYGEKSILKNIDWEIKKNEFWELLGKNGSGKTTLLSMIIGDNPKAFGKEIYLFGKKKGTGESVWDIKQKLGYYSPSMTDKFTGRHTIEHMLISGLTDSIGLYTRPTEIQKRYTKQWLLLLKLWKEKDILFRELSLGKQRLVMTARAMVKHPPLLILDEPTAGMDDQSAQLLVALVNKIARETITSVVFVSHRTEPNLLPKKIFHLEMKEEGSTGMVKNTA